MFPSTTADLVVLVPQFFGEEAGDGVQDTGIINGTSNKEHNAVFHVPAPVRMTCKAIKLTIVDTVTLGVDGIDCTKVDKKGL